MLSINDPSESIDGLSTNKTTTDLENTSSSSRQDAQKKKKKRSHESDQAEGIDSTQGKKKKRKHRDNDQESATQEPQPVVPQPLENDDICDMSQLRNFYFNFILVVLIFIKPTVFRFAIIINAQRLIPIDFIVVHVFEASIYKKLSYQRFE